MNHIFIVSVLCFLHIASLGSNARQDDALNSLLCAKYNKNSKVETRFNEDFQAIDEARILSQVGYKEKDRIAKLPGQPDAEFTQFGGYITVDEKHGRAFYYYFAEAEESKESKPLLLWLNGGPGCSSLGTGAMEELGHFRVQSDGKTLFRNPHAWNKVANVLFLESPAWVGFSYSNTSSDFDSLGDKTTAEDNYVFLVNWLQRFPEYIDCDFYISGESYAGHYIPQLGHTILQHNKRANKNTVNFKGIMIGNSCLNDETDAKGRNDFLWTHALISNETIYNIHKYCNFSPNATFDSQPPQCKTAAIDAYQDLNSTFIDPYNIYAPVCHKSGLTEKPKMSTITIDPCIDNYVSAYLNTPEVQEALHANVTRKGDPWAACNSTVNSAWSDSAVTILPLLREFLANGLRVWVYSGDVDVVVPVTSTKYSLRKLNLLVKAQFRPWIIDEEVGGYTEVYEEGLRFATVRGAGHMVPSYQPQRALTLITNFLEGKSLPSN